MRKAFRTKSKNRVHPIQWKLLCSVGELRLWQWKDNFTEGEIAIIWEDAKLSMKHVLVMVDTQKRV